MSTKKDILVESGVEEMQDTCTRVSPVRNVSGTRISQAEAEGGLLFSAARYDFIAPDRVKKMQELELLNEEVINDHE